jgi:hypothetical protein
VRSCGTRKSERRMNSCVSTSEPTRPQAPPQTLQHTQPDSRTRRRTAGHAAGRTEACSPSRKQAQNASRQAVITRSQTANISGSCTGSQRDSLREGQPVGTPASRTEGMFEGTVCCETAGDTAERTTGCAGDHTDSNTHTRTTVWKASGPGGRLLDRSSRQTT